MEQTTNDAAAPTPGGGKGRTLLLGVIVVVVVAVLAASVVGYLAYRSKAAGSALKDRATTLIEQADTTVVAVDAVVRAKITPDLAEKAATATAEVATADATLANALELLAKAKPTLTGGELAQAELLATAATARRDMLAEARPVLLLNAGAARALGYAATAWETVMDADKLADRSVTEYNKLTDESVADSVKLNRRASAAFSEARTGFADAEQAFGEAPFERYLAYVDARIALSAISKRSEQAWLSGDVAKANAIIAEYNAGDRKAVALATALPATPEQAVADAYAKAADAATKRYYAARDRAVAADAALRK